jgi:hypothetical protein
MDQEPEDDELELALARLEWAKAAHCLNIPEQAGAMEWHAAACEAARASVTVAGGEQE